MIRTNIQYSIRPEDAGKTVERFLRAQGFSRRLVITTKYHPNGILLDGKPARSNTQLQAGQILTVAIVHTPTNENLQSAPLPLSIVYEDGDIIVLDKAAGMPVHPSQGHYTDTLSNALAYYYQQLGEP
ncbi:MAG: RluA family pseudouridine synthase, partial [Eubacteriales bacterium]|nr:RluA family pseudouridine synthase [Eubacteriales bacterium]